MNEDLIIRITPADMQSMFCKILLKQGFSSEKALQCAKVFTANSIDGVYTHGVNRFPVFIQYVKDGLIIKDAEPFFTSGFGGLEQWDGNLGPGPLNAIFATEKAGELAYKNGIGCVAMSNTNHWMRGGYYGWLAAQKGNVFIGWSNTIANMPPWNAVDCKLGNNPLVMAMPFHEEAIVLDMAMSQFSFGAMEMAALKNEKLHVDGGFDELGKLTSDPSAILTSRRSLPIGYWKGAGLSLLLDILSAVLSGGLATHQITSNGKEHRLSQVFICINTTRLNNHSFLSKVLDDIIDDYRRAERVAAEKKITFPGERVLQTRKENLAHGIRVLKSIWEQIELL